MLHVAYEGIPLGILIMRPHSEREIRPFSAIEESTLAHLTPLEVRSDIFKWYTVFGSAGSAAGKLVTGWMVQHLQDVRGWTPMRSYRAVFLAYTVLGGVNFLITWGLSAGVELPERRRIMVVTRTSR
jgi:MFS family permease